jgi:hypothetical protein
LYWQDVVLNHFEKAERRRIMGLSSVSSGDTKLQPRGDSLREDLILTDGSPGLHANPEAGRFQEFPQYARRNSKGLPEPLDTEIKNLFGRFIYLMTTVSRKKRPSWSGLDSLKAEEKIKVMVTCVLTGTTSDTKGRLYIQAMETMVPYYLHKLTLTEIHEVAQVTSHKAAFTIFKIDPSSIVFHVGSQNEEERTRRLDLNRENTWFQLVLSQQGRMIDHTEAEAGEDEKSEEDTDEHDEDTAEEEVVRKTPTHRKENRLPQATDIASQLQKMGIGANTVAGHEEMQKNERAASTELAEKLDA